jgi:hypothetical protein
VRDGQARLPPGRAAPQRRGIPLVHTPARAKDEGAPKDQYAGRRRFEDHHGSPPGTEDYRATPSAQVHTFAFFSYSAKPLRFSLLRPGRPGRAGIAGPRSAGPRSRRRTR